MVFKGDDGEPSSPSDAAARAVRVQRGAEHLRTAIGELRIELACNPDKKTATVMAEQKIRAARKAILADRETLRASRRARADALGYEQFVPFEADLLERRAVLSATLTESWQALCGFTAERALAIAVVEYLDELERPACTTTATERPAPHHETR